MFEISETKIAGLRRLDPIVRSDARGRFVKTFHADFFAAHGLRTDFAESYYSLSRNGVLRGMHFQTPPAQHAKLVHCAAGRILDVVVDLRRSQPSYGQFVSFELDADKGSLLYIPEGCAHGFLALTDNAMTVYNVTSVYAPGEDSGILWSSFGFEWPISAPLLSDRDLGFQPLSRFDSPF